MEEAHKFKGEVKRGNGSEISTAMIASRLYVCHGYLA